MNLTIAVDDDLLEEARRRGVSLQQLLREYLERLVGHTSPDDAADELLRLMEERGGRSGGHPFRREDAHERRL